MRILNLIAITLLLIGGLNWGLVGLFDFDLVQFLFGETPMIARAVYVLVGLAAIYKIVSWAACKSCSKSCR
jgi:uncharacterized membrane protein YuzA (DUF378 family)